MAKEYTTPHTVEELQEAVAAYKQKHGNKFVSFADILQIILDLGYRRNERECIDLIVHIGADKSLGLGVEDHFIGCVELPANTTYDDACQKLNLCWGDWRGEVGLAQNDSQFINWLVKKHGWIKVEGNYSHTLNFSSIDTILDCLGKVVLPIDQ